MVTKTNDSPYLSLDHPPSIPSQTPQDAETPPPPPPPPHPPHLPPRSPVRRGAPHHHRRPSATTPAPVRGVPEEPHQQCREEGTAVHV